MARTLKPVRLLPHETALLEIGELEEITHEILMRRQAAGGRQRSPLYRMQRK
jgi:hypothetical protein